MFDMLFYFVEIMWENIYVLITFSGEMEIRGNLKQKSGSGTQLFYLLLF